MKLTRSNDTSSVYKDEKIKYHDHPPRKIASDVYNENRIKKKYAQKVQISKSDDMMEVDFFENPTEVYMRICASEWKNAMVALEKNPSEARTWVVKRDECHSRDDDEEEDNSVRFLPLHSACARQPPVDIVIGLLTVYPEASSIMDDNGMYPLHYACANQASAEVIGLLLLHHAPANLIRVDMGGSLPIHLCSQWGVSSPDVVDLLLEKNRSLALARDNEGLTPVEIALQSDDYDFREEVIEILQMYYEEEALNEGDDSTLSTHTSNRNKRRTSLVKLNQVVDVMREEITKLSNKRGVTKMRLQETIKQEWESVNKKISEIQREIEAKGEKRADRGLEQIENDKIPENDIEIESNVDESMDIIQDTTTETTEGNYDLEGDIGNSSYEYDIPMNLFDSESFEGEVASYSDLAEEVSSSLEENLATVDDKEERITPEDMQAKDTINKTVESKGYNSNGISPWLRHWRKLAGRNSKSQDNPADKEQLKSIDETQETNNSRAQKISSKKENKDGQETHVARGFSPKLSFMLVKKDEEPQMKAPIDIRSLSEIEQENELLELELVASCRRRNAEVSKFEEAESALTELKKEVWRMMETHRDAMRKLQILKDDFKVATAVRRAHLKSMLNDIDDDEIDVQRTTVDNSAGLLKNQRKTLSYLEQLIHEINKV